MAAPDEPAHAINAAAVVRGEVDVAEHPTMVGPVGVVRVPAWVASTNSLAGTFIWFPTSSAAFAPHVSSSTETVDADTQYSHYPPLYYAIAGIPSLLESGAAALYSMRMVGVLVNSSLIALGLFLLTRYHPRREQMMAGALIALTPMVLFLSSVLNTSGIEIAAAFAAWCAGLCIVEYPTVPKALAAWTSLPFAILIVSRPISPIYAVAIILTLGVLMGWSRSKELLRDRSTLPIRFSIVVALLAFGAPLIDGGFPPYWGAFPNPPHVSFWSSIWLTLSLTVHRLRQGVGTFGWLNTPVPQVVWVLWAITFMVLLLAGLCLSSRCRRAVPVLALVIIALPVVFESPTIHSHGIWWQGRYWLPLLIGVPLLAVSQLTTRKDVRRWTEDPNTGIAILVLAIVLITAQVWTFVGVLQRYEYGLGTGRETTETWAPPGGVVFVTGLFIVGMLLLLGFIAGICYFRRLTGPGLWPHSRMVEKDYSHSDAESSLTASEKSMQ
jgi:hypothetical protein